MFSWSALVDFFLPRVVLPLDFLPEFSAAAPLRRSSSCVLAIELGATRLAATPV